MAATHQSSDHDNTNGKSIPQSPESDVSIDAVHSRAERLTCLTVGIELADHHIGRVRHHSTQNTSQVSTGECNCSLGTLVVVRLLSWQPVIDHLDDCLKRGELHHGVWDLAAPEWVQSLVQAVGTDQYSTPELYSEDLRIDSPGHAFLSDHGRDTAEGAFNIGWNGCLHAHFDGLEGAQSYVGDELSRRTGSQVDGGLPFDGIFLTDKVTVEFLKELVAAVLECSLGLVRVSVYSN